MKKLTTEEKKIVTENIKLVHYTVRQLGVTPNSDEYDDIVSTGTMGLLKAASTYEPSKQYTFSTYAVTCIRNEILISYRNNKKHLGNISLSEPIATYKDGEKEGTLETILEDTSSEFVEKIELKEEFCRMVSIVLNCMNGVERLVILMLISGERQKQIAELLGISKSYVSMIIIKSGNKIKKIIEEDKHYEEVFNMSATGDIYNIVVSSKNIKDFNLIFSRFLENVKNVEDLPNFKVSCDKSRIVIQVPAHPNSFSFIAQIIKEIDEYSFSFTSNALLVTDKKCEEDSISESGSKKEKNVDDGKEGACHVSAKKMYSQSKPSKLVRDYMLSLDKFTGKELKAHFKDISETVINSQIYLTKQKGLISSTDVRGEYVVNKK